MRIPSFYHAFLICVRTVEYSDPSLLIEIDPKLSIVGLYSTTSTNDVINHSNILSSSSSPIVVTNKKSNDDIPQKFDSLIQQRILHRRIHSDPIFSIPKYSINSNHSRVASPSPTSICDESQLKRQTNIPSISYFQSDEYGSYGSSYDSRVDIFDQNKPTKLTLGQSTNFEHNNNNNNNDNRQSMSSEITLIDEQNNNLYKNRLSTLINNDETILSMNSTSPMDQSITISTNDYPIRTARLPHSSLFWPRKGQTLDNYIRECDLKTRTDVEKENAHFYFSEAIISAIEQIKFTQQCNKYFGQSWSSSVANMFSPCETTHTSSSNSSSSPPTQQYIPCNSKLFLNNGTKSLNREISLSDQHDETTESIADSSEPPNNFDWSTRSSVLSFNAQESSAEAIALALMETWKNFKVPTAPELFWMIPHDEDLPQELLPLPDGISIDPSEDYLSNEDGQRTKSGDLIKVLEPIVINLREHVLNCPLCYAKGFICEICMNEKDIIFPFDLDITSVCPG
ncbi:unnamed protein product [Rotaria sp. Silwood2]|nr:unnamed protein product [Rotaria sp. Silwood2]